MTRKVRWAVLIAVAWFIATVVEVLTPVQVAHTALLCHMSFLTGAIMGLCWVAKGEQ